MIIKERRQVQFQWQEAPARPGLRKTWSSTIPKNPRVQEPSLRPSTKSKKSFLNGGIHFSEAFSSNVALHPHQEKSFWAFDVQKLKPHTRMKDILPHTVLNTTRTDLPTKHRKQKQLLLEKRGALLDLEDAGTLSLAQAIHLRHIEQQLDWLEDQDPVEQEADRRLAQTGDKLDEILSLLRNLPRKDPADAVR